MKSTPYLHPSMSENDLALPSRAVQGTIVMYGLIGFGLAILVYFFSVAFDVMFERQIAIMSNLITPIWIGFMAGSASINGRLATSSARSAIHGASAAVLTAILFLTIFGSCVLLLLIFTRVTDTYPGAELGEIVHTSDVPIAIGVYILSIVVYAVLGALGGAVAGLVRGT